MGRFSSLKIALWSPGSPRTVNTNCAGQRFRMGRFWGGKKRAMMLFGPGPPCLKHFTSVTWRGPTTMDEDDRVGELTPTAWKAAQVKKL